MAGWESVSKPANHRILAAYFSRVESPRFRRKHFSRLGERNGNPSSVNRDGVARQLVSNNSSAISPTTIRNNQAGVGKRVGRCRTLPSVLVKDSFVDASGRRSEKLLTAGYAMQPTQKPLRHHRHRSKSNVVALNQVVRQSPSGNLQHALECPIFRTHTIPNRPCATRVPRSVRIEAAPSQSTAN